MEKRFQVFVSSTFTDLAEQREKVIYGLIRVGFIAVGMEQFPSTDESQLEYINKVIDESDYYIVIIKGRYGSVASDGTSYTEKEFNYATQRGIPCLAFVFKDFESLTQRELDDDQSKRRKFIRFRNRLQKDRIVSYWSNDDELVSSVKDSIHNIVRTKPGVGYIRGDEVIDIRVVNDRERLLDENTRLRRDIEILRNSVSPNTTDRNKLKDINSYTRFQLFRLLKHTPRDASEVEPEREDFEIDITWHNVLIFCSLIFDHTHDEKQIVKKIIPLLCLYAKISEDEYEAVRFVDEFNAARKIRVQLEALGYLITSKVTEEYEYYSPHRVSILIDATYDRNVKRGIRTYLSWELTNKGRDYVSYHMAEKVDLDDQ